MKSARSQSDFRASVVMVHWTTTCPVPPAKRELFRGLLRFWRYDQLGDDVAKAGVAEVSRAHVEARELGANFSSVLASILTPRGNGNRVLRSIDALTPPEPVGPDSRRRATAPRSRRVR